MLKNLRNLPTSINSEKVSQIKIRSVSEGGIHLTKTKESQPIKPPQKQRNNKPVKQTKPKLGGHTPRVHYRLPRTLQTLQNPKQAVERT